MKDKLVYLLPRRFGRNTILRALRATGDEALTHEQYQALFQGEFSIEGRDPDLVKLADEYHQRTEAFDRSVCTGQMGHGGILPANPQEAALINANAHRIRRELVDRAGRAGFTEAQFKEAMLHHIRRGPAAVAATAARQDRPAVWIDEYDVVAPAHPAGRDERDGYYIFERHPEYQRNWLRTNYHALPPNEMAALVERMNEEALDGTQYRYGRWNGKLC